MSSEKLEALNEILNKQNESDDAVSLRPDPQAERIPERLWHKTRTWCPHLKEDRWSGRDESARADTCWNDNWCRRCKCHIRFLEEEWTKVARKGCLQARYRPQWKDSVKYRWRCIWNARQIYGSKSSTQRKSTRSRSQRLRKLSTERCCHLHRYAR